jgi:phosphatidylglycerol:prolipoprotein diacylglycerol transferase
MLTFPAIDPVAISLFGFGIRWYALAYLAGVLVGWAIVRRVAKHPPLPLTKDMVDDLAFYVVLGVVLGGRLGYVIFYQFGHYLENPASILRIWQGGMSFHGGLAGVLIASALFARKHKLPFLRVTDLLALVTPIGLFFGRLANFINGELVGRLTDGSWGMVFAHVDMVPRHPSQLYEAALEGLVLFIVLLVAYRRSAFAHVGVVGGLFLAGYAVARIVSECFREPDAFLGPIVGPVTMGQLLSIPMLAAGVWLVYQGRKDYFYQQIKHRA